MRRRRGRYLLNYANPIGYAVIVAYLYGIITTDVLGRLFVFECSSRSVTDEYWRFTTVNLFAAAQVWIISGVLANALFRWPSFEWHGLDIAYLIGVAVPVFTSDVDQSSLSFAKIAE
jgi:putative flippase GtrA